MSEALRTEAHLENPDDFYAALVDLHAGLDAETSALANAQLVLFLANHIGTAAVLREAITATARLIHGREPALK